LAKVGEFIAQRANQSINQPDFIYVVYIYVYIYDNNIQVSLYIQ